MAAFGTLRQGIGKRLSSCFSSVIGASHRDIGISITIHAALGILSYEEGLLG